MSGVYLTCLHNIVRNILPNKILAKRHGFLVQVATSISHVQHHTHVVHKYRCRFRDHDHHLSKVLSDHSRLLRILFRHCELSTKFLGLHRGLEFWLTCCWCWYHHCKQPGYQYPSDLVVPMVVIHKHIIVQFIKESFSKLVINILTKLFILISKIILHLKLLIIGIYVKRLRVNRMPSFGLLLQSTKYPYFQIKMS